MNAANQQCPRCQNICAADAVFCSKCGQQFPVRSGSVQSGRSQCPACGYRLGSFDSKCPQCASTSSLPSRMYSAPGPPVAPATAYLPMQQPVVPVNQAPHVQCPACRQWVLHGTVACLYCATAFMPTAPLAYVNSNQAPVQQVIIQNLPAPTYSSVSYRPRKEKSTAGILALVLGGLGVQHFYLGNTIAGILSIVFCWTYIPALIGLIQGVVLLCMNEQDFHVRYG